MDLIRSQVQTIQSDKQMCPVVTPAIVLSVFGGYPFVSGESNTKVYEEILVCILVLMLLTFCNGSVSRTVISGYGV